MSNPWVASLLASWRTRGQRRETRDLLSEGYDVSHRRIAKAGETERAHLLRMRSERGKGSDE